MPFMNLMESQDPSKLLSTRLKPHTPGVMLTPKSTNVGSLLHPRKCTITYPRIYVPFAGKETAIKTIQPVTKYSGVPAVLAPGMHILLVTKPHFAISAKIRTMSQILTSVHTTGNTSSVGLITLLPVGNVMKLPMAMKMQLAANYSGKEGKSTRCEMSGKTLQISITGTTEMLVPILATLGTAVPSHALGSIPKAGTLNLRQEPASHTAALSHALGPTPKTETLDDRQEPASRKPLLQQTLPPRLQHPILLISRPLHQQTLPPRLQHPKLLFSNPIDKILNPG